MKILENPELPKEVFQAEAAPQLLAQAVRIFLANQQQGTQSALTRAEVSRTRRKLYKQKGTGGARHGDRKAPIFVGGGVTFAPKPRDLSLSFPKKMKQKALFGALTLKVKEKNLWIVSGMDKLTGKTKELSSFFAGLTLNKEKTSSWLIVTDTLRDNVYRAARNLAGGNVLPINQLSTYDVLKAGKIFLMAETLPVLAKSSPTITKKTTPKITVKKPKVKSKAKK